MAQQFDNLKVELLCLVWQLRGLRTSIKKSSTGAVFEKDWLSTEQEIE